MKKEESFEAVMVNKIVSESNRKHGGIGNIEVLAESIKADGLINPPTVAANGDGTYRVVAGRRRAEAVRRLKGTVVPVRLIGEGDADRLEAIGLAENVNRREMSPLDEAEAFKKLLDKGTAVEDAAAYYDRTVAGIRHRVRLCDLVDGVKEMFRDGKIKLSAAALVAGLPRRIRQSFTKNTGRKVLITGKLQNLPVPPVNSPWTPSPVRNAVSAGTVPATPPPACLMIFIFCMAYVTTAGAAGANGRA